MYLNLMRCLALVTALGCARRSVHEQPALGAEEKFQIIESALRMRQIVIGDTVRVLAHHLYVASGRNPEFRSLLSAPVRALVVGDTAEPTPLSERESYASRRWAVRSVSLTDDGRVTLEARVSYGREHFETYYFSRAGTARWSVHEIQINRFILY